MELWYQFLGIAIVAAFSGIFWLTARAIPLWLCRRFFPSCEWALTAPLTHVIRRLGNCSLTVLR